MITPKDRILEAKEIARGTLDVFDRYEKLMVTREKLVGKINDIDYDLEDIMEQIRDELESE